jgi:NDP-sugar pyrophosphorylase family protein
MLPLAILAGGYATRLGDLAKETPKCLIEVNGKPFVDWQLDLLIQNGYTDFVFCLSHKSDLVRDYLGDGTDRGVKIRYSLDGERQLGTGGAIQKALPTLGHEFGVIYGDSYLPIDYCSVEQDFLTSQCNSMMTVFENHNQYDTSNVEFKAGQLISYEKGTENTSMRHIDYGLLYFRATAFDRWAKVVAYDLSEVCLQLARNRELAGYEVFERFYEIGSVHGINEFDQYLRKRN